MGVGKPQAGRRKLERRIFARQALLVMMRGHRFAIQTSVSPTASPQAAVVGVIVTDDFELFFDTIDTTRKMQNLRQNPKIAFVLGGTVEGDERTVQYEGIADEPRGSELERLKTIYFRRFPDGPARQVGRDWCTFGRALRGFATATSTLSRRR